jgi:hypothetical protein
MSSTSTKIKQTFQKSNPDCPVWHKISLDVFRQAIRSESIVTTHDIISVVWKKRNGEEILCAGLLTLQPGVFHRYRDESGCWMVLPVFFIRYSRDELMKEGETHSMIFLNSRVAFVLSGIKGVRARYNRKMTWIYKGHYQHPRQPYGGICATPPKHAFMFAPVIVDGVPSQVGV